MFPEVLKEVTSVAVAPAPVFVDEFAATGVTGTGLPMAVPPLKKVTVPVAPTRLLLAEATCALSVTD